MYSSISITLPKTLLDELKNVKQETGAPISGMIREILIDNKDKIYEYAEKIKRDAYPPSEPHKEPVLYLRRSKHRVKKPLHKADSKTIQEVFDRIPFYTLARHWDAYHNPDRYTTKTLARQVKVPYHTLYSWITRKCSTRVGWFWKGWIVIGNTKDPKKPAIFKTKTTEEILEDLHTNYIELQPLTSRKDFEGCIRNYLECNGPSTALELYEEVVLNNYNAKFSKSRYMKRNAFTAIIRGVDGVVKTGKKRVKSTSGYYYTPIYAAEECAAK